MRTYELVVVVKPIPEAARKKVIDMVKSYLKDVKWVAEKDLGSKALKYKIKNELTGFYFDFELQADAIPADFEKKIMNAEEVLRHLLIRKK